MDDQGVIPSITSAPDAQGRAIVESDDAAVLSLRQQVVMLHPRMFLPAFSYLDDWQALAALIAKNRDGEGQHVEVPMFEATTNFNMLEHLCDATIVPPTGSWNYPHQLEPVRQPMRTKDSYRRLKWWPPRIDFCPV
jgi:hypothetical protein